jgi:two-component system, LytTR family, response regulator LytT
MNVLIIEDEVKTGKELKRLIEGLDDTIRVLGVLDSVRSAVGWLDAHPAPDLIFSDIQLGDGLSFDIFLRVASNAPVIFCTAFDEYAIQAFQANSIDYLLKPIDEERLRLSLEKYKKLQRWFDKGVLANVASQLSSGYKRTILLYVREKIIPVKTSDVAFVHAANGVVSLVTRTGHSYVCQYTMEQLERMLDPRQYFRANRQYILNREIIQDVEHYFNRRLYVKVAGTVPEKIIISKVRAAEFLQWMEW